MDLIVYRILKKTPKMLIFGIRFALLCLIHAVYKSLLGALNIGGRFPTHIIGTLQTNQPVFHLFCKKT